MASGEGDIILNHRKDTLYTHPFRQGEAGEGKFFTVVTKDDGATEEQLRVELSPYISVEFVFIKEKSEVTEIRIKKFRYRKNRGWIEDKTEGIKLAPVSYAKVMGIIKALSGFDLKGISERRISLASDALAGIDAETVSKMKTLLALEDGQRIVEELLNSGAISSKDIVNVGYRKAQLQCFKDLMQQEGFVGQYKAENGLTKAGAEIAWQHFFERNPWIFGYGLNYVWCTNIEDKALEQVVAGANFNSGGKRVDALLHTSAHISQFVLVEVKTPEAKLIGAKPRSESWAISPDLAEGIAQVQKTVSKFKQLYFEKAELKDADGNPLGVSIYNFAPQSFLIIGKLEEFKGEQGVNADKYSSFEIFRRAMTSPTVLTFDELYQRACSIVDQEAGKDKPIVTPRVQPASSAKEQSPIPAPDPEDIQVNDDDIPF